MCYKDAGKRVFSIDLNNLWILRHILKETVPSSLQNHNIWQHFDFIKCWCLAIQHLIHFISLSNGISTWIPVQKKNKKKNPTKHSDEKSILNVDTCAAFVMQGGRHVWKLTDYTCQSRSPVTLLEKYTSI